MSMQVRWNYKLLPNRSQDKLMSEWLITLRKHRNYMFNERKLGYDYNNAGSDESISYAYGAYCDVQTKAEFGSCCPLTCPVLRHGIIPEGIELTKESKGVTKWGSPSDIQSKATTKLREKNSYFARIDSGVLQRNIARLDSAFSNFWKHGRGFPTFKTATDFKSFENKPGRSKFEVNHRTGRKHRYSKVYLPGIGWMPYFDSRPIPEKADIRTVTVKHKADGWHISVLLDLAEELPKPKDEIKGIRGIDVGINKLVAFSDGSFAENKRFRTNQKTKRLFRIRQRRVSRKVKGSNNRKVGALKVARLHHRVAERRNAYHWQVAIRAHKNVDAVSHEELNIKGMRASCKPKRAEGRFLPNGQSAKRGLNRAIADVAWGDLFQKISWMGMKKGNHTLTYHPAYASQECSVCHFVSKLNRDGEKFLCTNCGHMDHADTQASRTGNKRVGLEFPSNKVMRIASPQDKYSLPGDSGKVTVYRYESASNGERVQVDNPVSKQLGLFESLKPEYEEVIV
jgi:putative transposase